MELLQDELEALLIRIKEKNDEVTDELANLGLLDASCYSKTYIPFDSLQIENEINRYKKINNITDEHTN